MTIVPRSRMILMKVRVFIIVWVKTMIIQKYIFGIIFKYPVLTYD